MDRLNASYSRTYLTRHNHRGPTLLRSIRGRETDESPVPAAPRMSLKGENKRKASDKNQDNNFIYGPPMSSEDEIEEAPKKTAATPRKLLKDEQAQTTASPAKRSASTAASSRPKRQKLRDVQSIDDIKLAAETAPIDGLDLFGMPSSGSQKRRQTYKTKFVKPEPFEKDVKPSEKKDSFKAPDAVEMQGKAISKTHFQRVDDVSGFSPVRKRAPRGQKLIVPASPEATTKPRKSEFRKFGLPDFPSSNGTEHPSIPDVFDSPETRGRKRSGSTSSLSSVDDMYLLAHNDDYKTELAPDLSRPLCPVCEQPVHDSVALFIPENLGTLPFQQQQKFCSQHKVADAKEEWEKRSYPKKIYWEELEGFRIREKLPDLKKVISRQAQSFYLDELDTQIKAAKGNRRKIRNYLNEGLINIAKAGYYGPKGARVMTNAVTSLLTETLNKALQSDPALRAAGVGAYVSAVLVPELTLKLVMDDMNLKSAKEGRKVLDESTDIGVLLNPDDDQVQPDEADE